MNSAQLMQDLAGFLFGDVPMMKYLLLAIVLDLILGFVKGIKTSSMKSTFAHLGFTKKFSYFGVIIVANIISQLSDGSAWFSGATVVFLIAYELVSIIENATLLGAPVPNFITDRLAVMKDTPVDKDGKIKTEK